jgi:hypothetical protein
LGRVEGGRGAVAVLADGRVVTGGDGFVGGQRVLVWDPTRPGAAPIELGRDYGRVRAVAVLADGRIVTGNHDRGDGDFRSGVGWVLIWDPSRPGDPPIELAHYQGQSQVRAVVALPDGRVAAVVRGWLRIWNPSEPASATSVACSAAHIAASNSSGSAESSGLADLVVLHTDHRALSGWSIPPPTPLPAGRRVPENRRDDQRPYFLAAHAGQTRGPGPRGGPVQRTSGPRDLLGDGVTAEAEKRATRPAGPGTTNPADDAAELRRLRRGVAELRRANEILKTASAFFAQAQLDRRLK